MLPKDLSSERRTSAKGLDRAALTRVPFSPLAPGNPGKPIEPLGKEQRESEWLKAWKGAALLTRARHPLAWDNPQPAPAASTAPNAFIQAFL